VEPFPAVSLPSKIITKGILFFLTHSCNFNNSICNNSFSVLNIFLGILDFSSSTKTINLPDAGNAVSVALAYDPTNLSIYLNGTRELNQGEDHGFIFDENSVLDIVKFGSTITSQVARNYIKSFAIFRRKLDDANLEAITSGNPLKQIKPSSENIFYGL